MAREFLKSGDRIYSTGCFLIYDEKTNAFQFDGFEGGQEYFDGHEVYFKPVTYKPYVERENI
jgi:hypothetical protein